MEIAIKMFHNNMDRDVHASFSPYCFKSQEEVELLENKFKVVEGCAMLG